MASSMSSSLSEQLCAHCLEERLSNEGYSYCYNCEKIFCVSCDKLHSKFASDHKISLAQDQQTDDVNQTLVPCKLHPGQTLDQYCQDDETILCGVCKTIKHRKCNVVSLVDAFSNKDVSKCLDELSPKLLALQETAKTVECDKQSFLERTEKKSDELRDSINYLREGLNKVLNGYEEQVNMKEKQVIGALKTIVSSYDTLISQAETELKMTERAKGNRTLETVSLINMTNLYNEYHGFVEEVNHEMTPFEIHITEDENLPALIQQLKGIGHRDIVDSEEVDEELTSDLSKKTSFLNITSCSLVKESDIKLPTDKKAPYITGLRCLSDGNLILCDLYNRNIKLLDNDMKMKFTLPCSDGPWDVDCINDSSVVVTVPDARSILFIDIRSGMKLKKTKSIDFKCYGAAVKKKAIYVCGGEAPQGIKVLNLEGDELSFIPHMGSGPVRYIHLNGDGTNICCTGGSGKSSFVTCLARDGGEIYSVTSVELKYPRTVVSDQTGNWLICDDVMKTIHVINKDGVVCNTLMSRKDDFEPKSLCMDFCKDIMVVPLWKRYSSKLVTFKLNFS